MWKSGKPLLDVKNQAGDGFCRKRNAIILRAKKNNICGWGKAVSGVAVAAGDRTEINKGRKHGGGDMFLWQRYPYPTSVEHFNRTAFGRRAAAGWLLCEESNSALLLGYFADYHGWSATRSRCKQSILQPDIYTYFMFHRKMCSTEVGYGYGVLRVNILLKQRGVSVKTVKNDKNGWKVSAKKRKRCQKRGVLRVF